ncbi:MAG: hypothetical protein ACK5OX_12630 [Desertimonas sp.]
MITIEPHELQAGDIVVDEDGAEHRVAHVDQRPGWSFSVAFDDTGWAQALGCRPILVDRAA